MSEEKSIELTVQTSRGTKTLSFPKQMKVSEVIAKIVAEFGFAPGDNFDLVLASKPNEPLQKERPLVSFHLEDGTTVILTAVGSGV